jgi:hypothetical protein
MVFDCSNGSNRCNISKVGLIVFAFLAALALGVAFIGFGLSRDAEYQRQADTNAREYAAYADQQARQSCIRLFDQKKADCIAKYSHEKRTNHRNEQDLVAQRQSANWAYIMGAAAVIGMILSVVGVVLVWTTFRETQKTNKIAAKNIDAYQRREAGSLYPKFSYRKPGYERGQFRLELINPGPTRIQIIHKQLEVDSSRFGKSIIVPINGTQTGEMMLIEAGKSYIFPNNHINETPIKVQIMGGAIYADIFGKISVCRVAIMIDQKTHKITTNENAIFEKWFEIASKKDG